MSPRVRSALYVLGFCPVLLVSALVLWGAFVMVTIFTPTYCAEGYCTLGVAHSVAYLALAAVFEWAYVATIASVRGNRVPLMFASSSPHMIAPSLIADMPNTIERRNLQFVRDVVHERTIDGKFRFCRKCNAFKPDRAHHCSMCGVCVLKMDHHCPWVNNCVGAGNYKFFVLFISYGAALCAYTAFTLAPLLFSDIAAAGASIMGLFFIACAFAIALIGFSLMHWRLLLRNETTLESFDSAESNPYNIGRRANFRQVFGTEPALWLWPIPSPTALDGVRFPRKGDDDDPTGGRLLAENPLDSDP